MSSMKMASEDDHTLGQTKLADIDNNLNHHQEYFSHKRDQEEEEEQDEVETLSLCDLPIYSDSFKWEDDFSSIENDNDDDDDDFFEFSSDDLTSIASSNPSNIETKTDNIVFCGKVIPYKGQTAHQQTHTTLEEDKQVKKKVKKKKSLFEFLLKRNRKPCSNDKKSRVVKGFPVGKVAVMAASASPVMVKPRWYSYAFGIVRFPAEIELRDMRTRQIRRTPTTTMFPSLDDDDDDDDKNDKETTKEIKVSSGRGGPKRRLRWLWRALGCGGARHVAKPKILSHC